MVLLDHVEIEMKREVINNITLVTDDDMLTTTHTKVLETQEKTRYGTNKKTIKKVDILFILVFDEDIIIIEHKNILDQYFQNFHFLSGRFLSTVPKILIFFPHMAL